MKFRERLKQLRGERGITQEELANALDIPASSIRRLESDEDSLPRKERLELIANYFKVSIDYLVGRTDEKNKTEYTIPPDENELIVKEIVEKYGVDLSVPGNREKLEDLIKIVFHKYQSHSE